MVEDRVPEEVEKFSGCFSGNLVEDFSGAIREFIIECTKFSVFSFDVEIGSAVEILINWTIKSTDSLAANIVTAVRLQTTIMGAEDAVVAVVASWADHATEEVQAAAMALYNPAKEAASAAAIALAAVQQAVKDTNGEADGAAGAASCASQSAQVAQLNAQNLTADAQQAVAYSHLVAVTARRNPHSASLRRNLRQML